MRSYDSATLVKTPATRSRFSASVTVSKPKCVGREGSGMAYSGVCVCVVALWALLPLLLLVLLARTAAIGDRKSHKLCRMGVCSALRRSTGRVAMVVAVVGFLSFLRIPRTICFRAKQFVLGRLRC